MPSAQSSNAGWTPSGAIEDTVTIVEKLTGRRPDLDTLPPDDDEVYTMLARGETIGVFQVESRAQANLIPNFKPRSFADLAILMYHSY